MSDNDTIREQRSAWLAATEDRLYDIAKQYGWICTLRSASGGGSSYYDLERIDDSGETNGFESVTVRISDHPSLYCSEDYSVSMVAGADDHSIETVELRLSKPAPWSVTHPTA